MSPRTIVIIVLVFLFTAFVFQNAEVVEIRFLVWKFPLSRVLLLLGALIVGFAAGFLSGWEIFGRKASKGTQKPQL